MNTFRTDSDTIHMKMSEHGIMVGGDDLHYTHIQLQPANEWLIKHNLGKRPSVTIVDSGDNVVIGEIRYIDTDSCIVKFETAFAGRAYLN